MTQPLPYRSNATVTTLALKKRRLDRADRPREKCRRLGPRCLPKPGLEQSYRMFLASIALTRTLTFAPTSTAFDHQWRRGLRVHHRLRGQRHQRRGSAYAHPFRHFLRHRLHQGENFLAWLLAPARCTAPVAYPRALTNHYDEPLDI